MLDNSGVCLGSLERGHKLLVEQWNCWWKNSRILQLAADLQRPFPVKGVLNSILVSVLCSFILLKGKVLGEIERSVVFKVYC